jgi:hypothetical protein
MKRRLFSKREIPIEEVEEDVEDGYPSAGQSGGSQGLSRRAEAASESIEELADSGQAFEADAVAGVEDASDHPEEPVRVHADNRRDRGTPRTGTGERRVEGED